MSRGPIYRARGGRDKSGLYERLPSSEQIA